jgi:drug/metabolite transporter (DMT)-like permease
VLIATLIFKQEKLTAKKIIACAMGFFGILVINLNGLSFTGNWIDVLGVILVVVSTIAYALSSVLIKRYSLYEDPVTISGYQFIIGGAFMTVIGLIFGGNINFASLGGVLDLIYLALLSAIAYSLWGILLKHNPVSRVTVFTCSTPIFGTVLTILLLPGESSSVNPVNLIITLALVSTGILLLNFKRQTK